MTRPDPTGVLVVARFNEFVTERLLEGATAFLAREGLPAAEVLRVPGAWEIPLAMDRALAGDRHDYGVALGALVRGETYHFDVLSDEVTRALSEISRAHGKPVGMGVLTVETMDQAVERAGEGSANKGWEAAAAAVDMVRVLRGME